MNTYSKSILPLILLSLAFLAGCVAKPYTNDPNDPNFEWDVECFEHSRRPTSEGYKNWYCVTFVNPCDNIEKYPVQCQEYCDFYDNAHSACDIVQTPTTEAFELQ